MQNLNKMIYFNKANKDIQFIFYPILVSETVRKLAKRSAKVLPADLCTDYAHYVKNHK